MTEQDTLSNTIIPKGAEIVDQPETVEATAKVEMTLADEIELLRDDYPMVATLLEKVAKFFDT